MSNNKLIARYYKKVPNRPMSRRDVLRGTVAASALGLTACGGGGGSGGVSDFSTEPTVTTPTTPTTPAGSGVQPIFGADQMTRQADVLSLRTSAATAQSTVVYGTQDNNGDEGLYADYRGSYSKGLPHNSLGEVDLTAFDAFLGALETGQISDFDALPLGGTRNLTNPMGAYKFNIVGLDSHKSFIRPAPAFESAETAAEMGEVYWKALCRDVPFSDFGTNTMVQAAIADLNNFSETVGPKSGGQVTTNTVFRGETPGDLIGPYISQFLLKDVPMGNGIFVQRYETAAPGDDHMTDTTAWLDIQNGVDPTPLAKGFARYINDARALAEYVHLDYSYQAYLNAALILLATPNSTDVDNPYNSFSTQDGFTSLGAPDVLDLVAKAANNALSSAWYQKWLVHRRLRPEVYGGRLHHQITGTKDYGLPDEIANSDAMAQVFANRGSYLLPMAYPEGSPTHPSYPAGHACMAGACVTILKAFFNEDLQVPNPVETDAAGSTLQSYNSSLTVGDELNKLANNISLGRDWAGVHYRSDGIEGMQVGEQQAIGLLQDYSRTYRETFNGFTFKAFDGTVMNISDGAVV